MSTYIGELLAILFLFKLLPVPIDFDILLMRLNDFVLDLGGPLAATLLLDATAVILNLFRLCLDLEDLLHGSSAGLLEHTYHTVQLLVNWFDCLPLASSILRSPQLGIYFLSPSTACLSLVAISGIDT